MRTPRTTIQRKLATAIVLTSTTVLLLLGLVLAVHALVTDRRWLVQILTARADMLAANSTAALAFENPDDATKVLGALRSDPHMEAAALYDRHGRRFATFATAGSSPLPDAAPAGTGWRFGKSSLAVFRPVHEDELWLGTIYLRSDLRALESRFRVQLLVVLIAVAGSIGIAYALSIWLRHRIARPVVTLTEAAQRVSDHRDYSVRVTAESDDELGILAETFNDMLRQIRQREEEIRTLNADLERRVVVRTAELAAANQELEAFSYSVSHDLRAPLRAIDGFSKALLDEYAPRLDDDGRRHLERVRGAAGKMGVLIDDLLDLARLSRAEMERRPVDLSAIGTEIALRLRDSQPERQVRFEITGGLNTEGDAKLLGVVLDNLLRNAWKFTSKHEEARIELGHMQNNGTPTYFVRDDGAGFDMAHSNLLFAPFQRLHRQADFEGTGIGLATVQRIIHRHRGRLWAEGAVERGAVFYFTLWDKEAHP